MPLDRKKLDIIHILKKELDLSDKDYRQILNRTAGVSSSKDLDYAGFRRLMHYFVRSKHYKLNEQGLTIKQKLYIQHLWEDDLEWAREHFFNFLKKYYHVSSLDQLSKKDASKVIESLKHIKEHQH